MLRKSTLRIGLILVIASFLVAPLTYAAPRDEVREPGVVRWLEQLVDGVRDAIFPAPHAGLEPTGREGISQLVGQEASNENGEGGANLDPDS